MLLGWKSRRGQTIQVFPRPGYGDEKTLEHQRPHTNGLRRWEGDDGHEPMTLPQQRELAEQCSAEALRFFGYDEPAELLTPRMAGSRG